MKFGVIITGGPVHQQVAAARTAEETGWDAVFTWDGIHVGDEIEVHNPWALLSAFAMATDRVQLGAIISPLPRRKAWEVARETVTVDHLSNGRLILPVGLGAVDDLGVSTLGEVTDRRTRAERLDESLEILTGLWTGEPFGFSGKHYRFEPMAFQPTPVQQPRIPIWVVGVWPAPRSMNRVARYDGLMPSIRAVDGSLDGPIPLDAVRDMRAWLDDRSGDRTIEIVIEGTTKPGDDGVAEVRPYEEAGATWWIEADWSSFDIHAARRRIEAGPPR